MDPGQVETILNYAKPKIAKQLKRCMRMISYNRRFIKMFAKISALLNQMLKEKRSKFNTLKWTSKVELPFT